MPVSMAEVRRALDPDEVDYVAAAALGEEALPHLHALVETGDPGMAAKAAYLAGLINGGRSEAIVALAATHSDARVRASAASAASKLDAEATERVITDLVLDDDVGVQKLALNSVPAQPSQNMRAQVRRASQSARHASLRQKASDVLASSSDS
jgi:HEAT repeat protein